MKRRFASVLVGAILSVALTPVLAAPGWAALPYSFAVIGDTPYGSAQLSVFPQRIAQINADPDVQMVSHLGDIGGPPNCSDAYYSTIKSNFDQFVDPLLYTPGDNEWADCSKASVGAANPLNRLAAVRQVFFPRPGQSLGRNPVAVTAQPGYPENVVFYKEGITFGMVHIVGSENGLAWWSGNTAVTPEQKAEVNARTTADISLIRSVFATAKANNSRAVALMTQADMFTGSPNRTAFGPLVKAIAEEASAYGKPVFLFNGDTHTFASDQPLASSTWLSYYGIPTAVPNLSRITVRGGSNGAEWLKVTVVNTANVLNIQRVPFGQVAAPVASFSHSISGLSATFDSSGSSGTGGLAGYAWTFGDGTAGTGVAPSHAYARAGTYSVTLKVTDSQGATASKTASVTVTTPTGGGGPVANRPPSAAFTSSVSGLAANVDGSASKDPDGSIASYTWTFGDGSTGAGVTATHSYAAAGSYNVTLTVTDDKGATGTATHAVTVTQATPPGEGVLAKDTFSRAVTAGLGSAETGGAWSIAGPAANFAVNGSAASIASAARSNNFAYLNAVSASGTDMQATIGVNRPTAGSIYAGLIGRRVGTATYGARVVVSSSGSVQLHLQRNTDVLLKTATIGGLNLANGDKLQLRVAVTGTSPTTISAKVWKTGTTEPAAWQLSAPDSTAGLQAAGAVGIYSYLSTTGAPNPLAVSFDNLQAIRP